MKETREDSGNQSGRINTENNSAHLASEAAPESGDQARPDPVAISKSLRRVRASGSLIVEAAKKQQDEMNKIIAQAIEGFEERSEAAGPELVDEAPAPEAGGRNLSHVGVDRISPHQSAVQAAPRKPTGPFESTMGRSGGILTSSGQLPPNGPSSVLAQASGLNPKSGVGPKLRIALITLALLLATGTYFAFRDRLLTPSRAADVERNLMRVEDQSDQYIRLGERDREQGHLDNALSYFQQAQTLTPNNPNVHFLIGQTQLGSGQIDDALKSYKAVLRIAPEHLEARLQVAEIYRTRGNWNAAYQEYQRIIALDQSSGQAAVALEAIEAHQAGEIQPPINAANASAGRRQKTAVKNNPVLPPNLTAQSQIPLPPPNLTAAPAIKPPEALNSGKPEDNPDPRTVADLRKKLGLRYLNVKEFRAAINEFLTALRLTPDDKDIYYFLGSSYYGLGQHALAHDYYKRVDRGQYIQVAQSGAQRTEKAAREEYKRRMEMLKNEAQNEVNKKDAEANEAAGRVSSNGFNK